MLEMKRRTRLNVASRLQHVTEAQAGYFTRSQANKAGVADFELERALGYDQVTRLDSGVYRLVGAPVDPHEQLRVAWLRLTPHLDPAERTLRPAVWASHRSAAVLHGFGDFIADVPEFIATRRIRPRFAVKVRVKPDGLVRTEWSLREGFAVTSPVKTFIDLAAAGTDGGHLGRYIEDAVATGATTVDDLRHVTHIDIEALLSMAAK